MSELRKEIERVLRVCRRRRKKTVWRDEPDGEEWYDNGRSDVLELVIWELETALKKTLPCECMGWPVPGDISERELTTRRELGHHPCCPKRA